LEILALVCTIVASTTSLFAQQNLDITDLWSLVRLSPMGMSADGKQIYYRASTPNIAEDKSSSKTYALSTKGVVSPYTPADNFSDYDNAVLSPDGKRIAFSREVAIEKIKGSDKYRDLPKSNAYIFTSLNNRHWDTWEDGSYSHIFVADVVKGKVQNERDIMAGEKYDAPTKPFGGSEDLCWTPDSKQIIYVCKKKYGTDYALSTNTDLYAFDIATGQTENLTEGMMGYDMNPSFSPDGKKLAWQSMRRDGFESDKQDLIVMDWTSRSTANITRTWDESTSEYKWAKASDRIYFSAPYRGTKQLFEVNITPNTPGKPPKKGPRSRAQEIRMMPIYNVVRITEGVWDVNDIIGDDAANVFVTRTDMNHASEIFSVAKTGGTMTQLSSVNTAAYKKLNMCKVEGRTTTASDGEELFSWVVYPPNFDPTKKYPTLLYCQGGPQGSISQFYSFRWNFQLMASKGYIVVVPNRRGCQGWGTKWNEAISKDWGGQAIQDYLSAFDDVARENYVDKNKCAAVGASYGGYSVFMLAGVHNNRFKSFIAHDGLFDLRSWYGTTEELFFANWDIGGPYWDKSMESYSKHNPSNLVDKWNTPIMIVQGGKDFRVGIEQGLQAFQAAQLKGIKSKLLYLPEENHWVLRAQNAQVWQREFFDWLKETL
jgi:dipeptidyl aminopeptidase/acylaminoacyl peptidase